MDSSPRSRPPIARQQSKVPGGFSDTDEELSPIKTEFDLRTSEDGTEQQDSQLLERDDGSLFSARVEHLTSHKIEDSTSLEEDEIRMKLMDLESSFLPELSPAIPASRPSTNDTSGYDRRYSTEGFEDHKQLHSKYIPHQGETISSSLPTPPEAYKTPAPRFETAFKHDNGHVEDFASDHVNTSSLETMSSSPTAAAAARTVSRVVSRTSLEGYETADDQRQSPLLAKGRSREGTDDESTPRKSDMIVGTPLKVASPVAMKPSIDRKSDNSGNGNINALDHGPVRSRKRPRFINSRLASQRSSYSSNTTTSTEGASDVTVGADYALQTAGATLSSGSRSNKSRLELSRATSFGSMASRLSNISDTEDDILSGIIKPRSFKNISQPETPTASGASLNTPTETVIAQRVSDIQVPATIAREYRDKNRPMSPDKRSGMPSPSVGRNGKSLTLKEQSSTIDRLGKENWDLKLKIMFLDNALNQRSDEGVKAMISENVELRTSKFKSQNELRELRRTIRELEKRLKEREEEGRTKSTSSQQGPQSDDGVKENEETAMEMIYLRQRIENYETEIGELRNEGAAREAEKRRLAATVRSISERRNGNNASGAQDETDLWRDLLETETSRREQADEDNKKLREEILQLKSYAFFTSTNRDLNNVNQIRKVVASSVDNSDYRFKREGATSAASSTLVDQLRHENAELRREVGAQTSMLTSRNREKERLYQEIEDLKLGQRRGEGSRSVTGDSILERSASRAQGRSASLASGSTKLTQMSDAERESYEIKNGQLRDRVAQLMLERQDLEQDIDRLIDELESADIIKIERNKLQRESAAMEQDLQLMANERDDALHLRIEMEAEFEDLKAEAQERINSLEDTSDQKNDEIERLSNEIDSRIDESNALRNEVRSMGEGLLRIEDDVQSKIKRIQELELENEDINHETEVLEKNLHEATLKMERLNVQQESSRNEIKFLREEQESDKIKIGQLESAQRSTQASLDSEKDRAKDLDARLAEERHQREVIGSKEKQEVQKIINDLNREASAAKDETRKVRKSLQSREAEATEWKDRLMELESSLREALGNLDGTKSSFLTSISNLQKELDSTASDLDMTRSNLDEKDRLLQHRDALLESHGLELRKVAELLERERLARRADKAAHEQWQKTHVYTTRTVSQKETRINELENSRQADRKKLANIEQQHKEQLIERNDLLLALWNRLSTMCGSDWQHQNTLVNGHFPSVEVVSNMLPSFSKNLLLAMKTVEELNGRLRNRIRGAERDLWKEYQTLEQNLDLRIKRLDKLENMVQNTRSSGSHSTASDTAKLRGENRMLKDQVNLLQKQEMHGRAVRSKQKASSTDDVDTGGSSNDPADYRAALTASLMRHHSSSAVSALERGNEKKQPETIESAPMEPSQQRWIHRLRELERRLKAEREARLQDRNGARRRLEEGRLENKELRSQLERERVRRGEPLD